MSKAQIAIYPRTLKAKIRFGYSFGWYRKEKGWGEYILSFGNCKTRGQAIEVIKKSHPEAEIVNLDYTPRNRLNSHSWVIDINENDEQYFLHYPCGLKSYHPEDIKNKYCAACHTFPEDEEKRAKLESTMHSVSK